MNVRKPDLLFLIMAGVLLVTGLVMLNFASGPVAYQKFDDPYWYLRHQVLFGLLPGLVLFAVTALVDYRFWRRAAPYLFGASILLLILVFVPGFSATWSASKSWVRLVGLSFQPVEAAKLALLIFLAAWFAKVGSRGARTAAEGIGPFLAAVGAVSLLVMLQPDFGSLMVIVSAAAVVFFLAGAKWTHLSALAAAGAALLYVTVKTAPHRTARFMTFLHPELDPRGIGYHINQAFLAIGSGGFFGLGLGHSRQKYLYLPEVIGDSIFAVMAEELGFFMTALFLILLAAFFWRGLLIAERAPDDFGRLLAAGIMGWIFFQALFNLGSMVGLLPVTGLPLPFVSYGGTAMAMLLAALGLLANISMQGAGGRTAKH